MPTRSGTFIMRRQLLKQAGLLVVTPFLPRRLFRHAPFAASLATRAVIRNRAPLGANALYPQPLGSIRPRRWLLAHLRLQAGGLSGHLDETWPEVGSNSGWLGGTGEFLERGRYYFDGFLPVADLVDYAHLKAKAQKYVDWTLDHQAPDGMIGSVKINDRWSRIVMLKVLTQYQEATRDPRVSPLMDCYFRYQAEALPSRPMQSCAGFRCQDERLSVIWLYNRLGSQYWVKLRNRSMTADGQVFPASQWNDALQFDRESPEESIITEESTAAAGPLTKRHTTVRFRVKAPEVDQWRTAAAANPIPPGSIASTNREEVISLIPYAAAKLRISAFPDCHHQVASPHPITTG